MVKPTVDEAFAKDVLKEVVLDFPETFNDWISIQTLADEYLHQWDRMRLDEKYGQESRAFSLVLAAKTTAWLQIQGSTVEDMEVKYRKGIPDFSPKDYPNALLELGTMRVAMRSWKELAATTWDLTKKVQNAWATLEDINSRLVSALAAVVFYRQQCIELRHRLDTHKIKVTRNLDPTKSQIKAIITKTPDSMVEITKLVPIHKLLSVEE